MTKCMVQLVTWKLHTISPLLLVVVMLKDDPYHII